jgi:glycogen(starch) synthase
MRVVIWTDAFLPEIGGMEVFCLRLVRSLREKGHECLIVADRQEMGHLGQQVYDTIPVLGTAFFYATRRNDLALLRRQHEECARVMSDFNPDVIHLNGVTRSVLGFVVQQRNRRRPTVLTLHDHSLFRLPGGINASLLHNVDALAAISESVQAHMLERDPKLAGKMSTILNSVPEPKLPPAPLPFPPRLLAYGRIIHDKGFDLAIKAFARIAPLFPAATLTIAGHGAEVVNLQKFATETGFADRIHFSGWIHPDKIPEMINAHSLIIMPSRWKEPFGLVALETAQMGRPIVASRIGGIPEIVVDGVTGQLFEADNVDSLTEALQPFLTDPLLGEKMGTAARLHARKNFDFDDFTTAYEKLYAQVAVSNGSPRPRTAL